MTSDTGQGKETKGTENTTAEHNAVSALMDEGQSCYTHPQWIQENVPLLLPNLYTEFLFVMDSFVST